MQWVADLAYGAGLVFVAVTLVGDAMEAGTALDVTGMTGDYSVLRALTVGHTILFGSIGCVLTALVAAASAYVTLGSEAFRGGRAGSPTASRSSTSRPCRPCSVAQTPRPSSQPAERAPLSSRPSHGSSG